MAFLKNIQKPMASYDFMHGWQKASFYFYFLIAALFLAQNKIYDTFYIITNPVCHKTLFVSVPVCRVLAKSAQAGLNMNRYISTYNLITLQIIIYLITNIYMYYFHLKTDDKYWLRIDIAFKNAGFYHLIFGVLLFSTSFAQIFDPSIALHTSGFKYVIYYFPSIYFFIVSSTTYTAMWLLVPLAFYIVRVKSIAKKNNDGSQ